jgi:hypothetical protein
MIVILNILHCSYNRIRRNTIFIFMKACVQVFKRKHLNIIYFLFIINLQRFRTFYKYFENFCSARFTIIWKIHFILKRSAKLNCTLTMLAHNAERNLKYLSFKLLFLILITHIYLLAGVQRS